MHLPRRKESIDAAAEMLCVMVDMDSDERITMLIDSCTGKVVNTLRIRVNELTSQDVTF